MNSNSQAPIATQSVFSRPAALIGGGIALVAVTAAAATFALRSPSPSETGTRAGTVAAAPAALMATDAAAPDTPTATSATPPKPMHTQRGHVQAPAPTLHAAGPCATCGKVESVNAVKQKGEGTGLGVVGGAVVGGLLGHQMGGGSGKKVTTVLGAVGGGVAGNEVEKHARATTVYQVKVRMDDGSLRTLTQSSAPAVGQKVTVEGSTLRVRASAS
jgi:outer membrane lipoprotein SlyB